LPFGEQTQNRNWIASALQGRLLLEAITMAKKPKLLSGFFTTPSRMSISLKTES
jgi:hypothetical protein